MIVCWFLIVSLIIVRNRDGRCEGTCRTDEEGNTPYIKRAKEVVIIYTSEHMLLLISHSPHYVSDNSNKHHLSPQIFISYLGHFPSNLKRVSPISRPFFFFSPNSEVSYLETAKKTLGMSVYRCNAFLG